MEARRQFHNDLEGSQKDLLRMGTLVVAQSLERIGDHATNIGEWVIFMVEGVRRDLNT